MTIICSEMSSYSGGDSRSERWKQILRSIWGKLNQNIFERKTRILYHDSGVLFVYWSRKVYSRYACIIKLKWKNTEKSLCNESYTPFDLDKPYIFGLKLILSSGARPTWPTWAGAWTAPHSTTSLSSATSTRTW